MKEYKYKINGNVYKVAIGDIEDNIAHVEVNGTPYKVEMAVSYTHLAKLHLSALQYTNRHPDVSRPAQLCSLLKVWQPMQKQIPLYGCIPVSYTHLVSWPRA